MSIHHTAIIEKGARIASTAQIGPYSIIGKDVVIEDGVRIHSHACISGITVIGENTEIFPFVSIQRCQDLKYQGEASRVIIGKNNTIREYVTINHGTIGGGMETVVGDNCLLMISVHIAHDCRVGNNVVIANNAALAGHVDVGDDVIIGGMSGFRQFVRIGKGAIIGGGSMVDSDVIPYGNVIGERAKLMGLNLVGLKRRNTDKDSIQELLKVFKYLFNSDDDTLEKRLHKVLAEHNNDMVNDIAEFISSSGGKVGLCLPHREKRMEC